MWGKELYSHPYLDLLLYNDKSMYMYLYIFHFRMELGEEPLVKTAASVFKTVCYNNRDSLSAGILVAGWDKRLGGQVSLR